MKTARIELWAVRHLGYVALYHRQPKMTMMQWVKSSDDREEVIYVNITSPLHVLFADCPLERPVRVHFNIARDEEEVR